MWNERCARQPPEDSGLSGIGRGVLLWLVAILGACSRPAPLPPEVKAIVCPTNRPAHASATFAKARITFPCISKELADSPYLLRCDLESRPMICEDDGSLLYSRNAKGDVYVGPLPEELRRDASSAPDLSGASRLIANFRKSPPRTETFEEVESETRFLLADGQALMPDGFTLSKGPLCYREATVLNTGTCNLEARSASLYWHVQVAIHAERGTPISGEEYREEIASWLKLLGKLVRDPDK